KFSNFLFMRRSTIVLQKNCFRLSVTNGGIEEGCCIFRILLMRDIILFYSFDDYVIAEEDDPTRLTSQIF
ncbi:hypothetical protein M153_12220003137, partial [Pseudoloma neurophilia]